MKRFFTIEELYSSDYVSVSGECILWNRGASKYGIVSINGKNFNVHRLVAMEAFGGIPEGMVVAHKCDTPRCVNKNHLFICTQKENLQDMKNKGRSATGEKHRSKKYPELILKGSKIGGSKLSNADVLTIRTKYVRGTPGISSPYSLTGLAKEYNISFQEVSKIINNKRWSWLEKETA